MKFIEREEDESWKADGACSGLPTIWWYQNVKEPNEPERRARKICEGCPVRRECLEYALRNREKDGVWGGLNTDDRDAEVRKIRRHHGPVPYEQIVERIAR